MSNRLKRFLFIVCAGLALFAATYSGGETDPIAADALRGSEAAAAAVAAYLNVIEVGLFLFLY